MWHPSKPQWRMIVLTALTILITYLLGDRDPLGMLVVLAIGIYLTREVGTPARGSRRSE
jgi:hypothetical protein